MWFRVSVFVFTLVTALQHSLIDEISFLPGLVVLSHIVWSRFFAYDYQRPYLTLEYVIGFFLIMVWLIPFAYFISLAANESVLPGAGGARR